MPTVPIGSLITPGGDQGPAGPMGNIPIAFVFPGKPAATVMINVPLIMNLSIPAGLTGSAYYNATDPSANSVVFTLTSQPDGTVLGTITKPTSGPAVFAGAGSSSLVAGQVLRMTVTTADATFADIGITILATRR